MNRVLLIGCLTGLIVGCGGKASPPAAPTPTVSSVSVTVSGPIRMGQTTQASGTATLSNGQSQSIVSGWKSDAPSIATVSDSGVVTGIANGQATIFVTSAGQQGQQVVRVVPDYQGAWSGRTAVTACTQSGVFATVRFCDEFPVGSTDPYGLSLTQTGESITARLNYGSAIAFAPVTTSIATDGTCSFVATYASTETINATVVFNSTTIGALTGTINEIWSVPGLSGQATLAQNIVGTTRTSTATLRNPEERDKFRLLQRLAARP